MNLCGLSDSLVRLPSTCPTCGVAARVNEGECLGCLLQAGLEAGGADEESFDAVLADIEIRDSDWRLGNYHILEEIGRGGMGVIYRARQRHSKRIVALKRVLGYHGDSRETLERFRREAEAAASLDHPNILPIYEVGEADGLPFFTMKYATGGTLQQAAPGLRDNPRESIRLLAKITRAVAHAHSAGILHRDLKPGNILLDGRGEPMVTDFGLAKWIDALSNLTRSLAIFGTPGFIAPEQASGDPAALTPAADVYSLGAILFDLLAGRPPFLGEHALAVIRQAAERPAPKLRSLVQNADRDLETICARCLEREPQSRYQSARDLADDLDRWAEGRPIIARPVLLPSQVWRWSRRNPLLASAAGAGLILAAIATTSLVSRTHLEKVVRNQELANHSVVVTPFEDLDTLTTTSEGAQRVTQALGDGLQQQGVFHLSSSLDHFAAPTVFWKPADWRNLGMTVGAREILCGTTRKRGDKLRVVFRVIEAASGEVVRRRISEIDQTRLSYDELINLAADDLRSAIGNQSRPKARAESPSATAREYLRTGKEYYFRYNPADTKTSQLYFSKAIKADPECAEAQAMFALAAARHFQQRPDEFSEQEYTQALAAATAAVRLDPELAQGYLAQAALLQRYDVVQSQEAAMCALELNPEDVVPAGLLGLAWRMRGRPDRALRWLERSSTRGQRPGTNSAAIADALTELGEDDAAERAYLQRLEFWPDLPDAHVGLAHLWMYQGKFLLAREKTEEAVARYGDHSYPRQMLAILKLFRGEFAAAEADYRALLAKDRNGGVSFYCSVSNRSALGFLRLQAGDIEEGMKLLAETEKSELAAISKAPEGRELLYDLAAVETLLGKHEEAFASLERALAAGAIDFRALSLDPRFQGIRSAPRFQSVIRDMERRVVELRNENRAVEKLAQNKKEN